MDRKDRILYFAKLEAVQKKGQEHGLFPYDTLAACLRCGYWWKKRVASPKTCPRCLSKHWQTLRRKGNRQGMRPEVK